MTERTHNKVHQIDPLTRIKHPILNGQIEVLTLLDQGHTAEVYHCRDLLDSGKQYALKLFKPSYLKKDRELKAIQNEIDILKALDNQRIVKLIEAGQDGAILNISGSVTHNLIYILLEYIPGGTLFNFCHLFGPMGEDTGRFFLIQMIEALKVIHQQDIVHLDLKPENFLLDEKLNLKLVDFGFARFQKDGFSNFWGGSYSYMSPEINEQVEYNGKHADIFAMGVVLFIIVVGIFPFQAATEEDYFYNLMQSVDEHQKYWQKIEAEDLSPEFKSLIRKMFAYEGEQRPTLDEIANHPWLRKDSFSFEKTQQELQVMLKNESKYNSYSSYLTIESKEESSFEEKKF